VKHYEGLRHTKYYCDLFHQPFFTVSTGHLRTSSSNTVSWLLEQFC